MNNAQDNLGSFITNSFGDSYLYQVNRNAFNLSGSDSLYRSLLSEKLFEEYHLHIVIGTDSGIFPKYVAKNGVPAGSRFIFVELPIVLDALAHGGKLDDLPPEIAVITYDALAAQCSAFNLQEYVFLDAVRVQESAGSSDANLPEYRELSWSVHQDFLTARHGILTSTHSSQFTLRQLENLAENRLCFSQTLKGAFKGYTAIILAGGPSMRGVLPWVRRHRDRVLVIAASRISRILREEGIVPHVIVSVDPQHISFEVSREMLLYADEPDAPLFAYSHHASPLLVGQWAGKSVYFGARLPWRSPLNVDALAYNGPTVSNSALSLAMHMECSSIVLAGVDLCFSAEGSTHAAGSNENKVGPDLSQLTPQAETYGGRLADTNQGYAASKETLAYQAKLARSCGLNVYNCSTEAARVPFIEYLALDDVEVGAGGESPTEVIARHVPESTSSARLTHYRQAKKEIDRARAKFQQILNLSREALDCTDGLFGRNGRERDFRHKTRMDKIEKRLDKGFGDFSALVKRFGLKRFLNILKTPKEADEWTDEQIENATRDYYQAYVDGTELMISLMENTAERIEMRMAEEKRAPDLDRLFAQWRNDQQYGRVDVWLKRNAATAEKMEPADREAVEQLHADFTRQLTEEATAQMSLLEQLHDLRKTRSKALILYRRQSVEELEAMRVGLAAHPDQAKSLPYQHFVEGLLAELKGDVAAAAGHYEELLTDPPHILTEDALLQIANLSVAADDADNALLAIECLTGISPSYLPPYGEILKLVGRFEDAFNAYNRYLGLVPEDVGATVRLAMFCREAKLNDAAVGLLNRALASDPMHSAARQMLDELTAEANLAAES